MSVCRTIKFMIQSNLVWYLLYNGRSRLNRVIMPLMCNRESIWHHQCGGAVASQPLQFNLWQRQASLLSSHRSAVAAPKLVAQCGSFFLW